MYCSNYPRSLTGSPKLIEKLAGVEVRDLISLLLLFFIHQHQHLTDELDEHGCLHKRYV